MLKPKSAEIKKRRMARTLSQRQLSILCGLPDNAICRIEKGDFQSIYPIRARAIAQALQCELYELFEECGNKSKEINGNIEKNELPIDLTNS